MMYMKNLVKNEIREKKSIITLVIVILISLIAKSNLMQDKNILKIAILDSDNTPFSKELIEEISKDENVEITILEDEKNIDKYINAGKYNIYYKINKNFSEKIKKGKINGLIEVVRNQDKKETCYMDDKISLIVLKNYIENDVYKKILKINNNYSYEKYREKIQNSKKQNEILLLDIEDMANGKDYEIIGDEKIVSLFLIVFFTFFYCYEIAVSISYMKKKGLLNRLNLAGISIINIYLSNAALFNIKNLLIIIICIFLLGLNIILSFKLLLLSNIVFLLFLSVEKVTKSYENFDLLSRILFFAGLLISYTYLYVRLFIFG